MRLMQHILGEGGQHVLYWKMGDVNMANRKDPTKQTLASQESFASAKI